MTTIEDDRTAEQRKTHVLGVAMTDAFMSGWGGAQGGSSVAIWACATREHFNACEAWVRNRKEARRVRYADLTKPVRARRGVAHVHVYVVESGHVCLRALEGYPAKAN